jgi:hypothetical protein
MKTTRACAALAATFLASTAAPAGGLQPEPAYQPLAFLVGHCWRGTLPDGKLTDEHCFSWIYGGKFVRDVHVLERSGQPQGRGESIYLWDAPSQQLQYLYIESAGGYSRGSVSAEGATLVFPPAHYVENGQEQTYRSRWQRKGEDAYDVVTEFKSKDGWAAGFSVHMHQAGPSPGT